MPDPSTRTFELGRMSPARWQELNDRWHGGSRITDNQVGELLSAVLAVDPRVAGLDDLECVSVSKPKCACGTPVHVGYVGCYKPGCGRSYTTQQLQAATLFHLAARLRDFGEIDATTAIWGARHLHLVPGWVHKTLLRATGAKIDDDFTWWLPWPGRRGKAEWVTAEEWRDRAESLEAENAYVREVLQEHHRWHDQPGLMLVLGEAGEFDASLEYADSSMCERTMAALDPVIATERGRELLRPKRLPTVEEVRGIRKGTGADPAAVTTAPAVCGTCEAECWVPVVADPQGGRFTAEGLAMLAAEGWVHDGISWCCPAHAQPSPS
jgi:hypothetical protein